MKVRTDCVCRFFRYTMALGTGAPEASTTKPRTVRSRRSWALRPVAASTPTAASSHTPAPSLRCGHFLCWPVIPASSLGWMLPGRQRLPEEPRLLVEIEKGIFFFVELFILAGHHVQLHGMRSDDLEFDVALGAPDHGATSLLELFGDSVCVLYIGTRGGVLWARLWTVASRHVTLSWASAAW